jgi:hypothetical protein
MNLDELTVDGRDDVAKWCVEGKTLTFDRPNWYMNSNMMKWCALLDSTNSSARKVAWRDDDT